jgi:hypothetical protein
VEVQMTALAESSGELERRADEARAAGQPGLARESLARKNAVEAELGERSSRPGLTSYEAWYVALAEFLGAKLATLATRLALVPGPRCGFCLPPPPPA